MKLHLPDCQGHEDPFALSPEDRRELVRRIAEGGPDAIDAFIREREAEGDSAIAQKVRKLREQLMQRAQELKRRVAGEYAEREEALEAEYRAKLARLQTEEGELKGKLEKLRAQDVDVQRLMQRAGIGIALSHDVAARPPWWRRVLRWLGKLVRFLLAPLRWLLGPFLKPRKGPDRAKLILPGGAAGGGVPLDKAGDLYLTDQSFRNAVKARLRTAPARERMRSLWQRLLGMEDYESLAQKAMQQMLAEEAERERNAREEEARGVEETLAGILEREREAQGEGEEARRRLAREREEEARRLEARLRSQPEADVKEAIVDEMKAAGLLRETGKGLLPTLQFMDRFAALVYDEEAAGSGRAGGGGEYAEGEGHYRREPLRSAVELSRMDIPASLLRARSRHPKVRHMTEADVVVHREERASQLQVVLIVDRSGSMEENGRMEAAKRAALALHHAVRAKNPRNRVDVLLMDTSVRQVRLRDVWETEPTGFTNTASALRMARQLIRRDGRALVYLVTDGLPEAYTKNGEDVAGHPDKAMEHALREARELSRERSLSGFTMLLLEPEDEMYVKSAEKIATQLKGRVVPVDPQTLTRTLLRQLDSAREGARVVPA